MITYDRNRTYPDPEEFLYYEGSSFRVEWYYTEGGRLPGLEYYRAMGEAEQERLDCLVRYLADSPLGVRLPTILYRIEDKKNGIYAFKARDERFFNFMAEGGRILITNAYRKHSQKMSSSDLEKLRFAGRCREDFLRRLREGIYYEAEESD
jgi:hypothetical protein